MKFVPDLNLPMVQQNFRKSYGRGMEVAEAGPVSFKDGSIIEKGGVNFSAVYGKLPETVKKALGL
jgi:coproporphyrinogen III oxidase